MRFPPRSGALTLTVLASSLLCFAALLRADVASKVDAKKPDVPKVDVEKKAEAKQDETTQPVSTDRFAEDVGPLLKKFCIQCHGKNKPKAGLNLAGLKDSESARKQRKLMRRVRESLEGDLMPPEGKPQPGKEQVAALIHWLETTEEKIDCVKQADPGRVTMRRLNRVEYRNTVRDLLGVDFQVDDDFPSDDVGYGFDNIGDVLTLPPILMEKYLAASATIAEQAITGEMKMKMAGPRRVLTRVPKAPGEVQECARELLEQFARRVYRRPVTGGEVAKLLKLFNLALENGDSFERGIQLAVQATLVSSQFLFRAEMLNGGRRYVRDSKSAATIPVGEFELASRLSYFLWSSTPDDELLKLAQDGSLSKPETSDAQVRRMLKDPRSQALVENFAGQWLQLRNLKIVHPDQARFPSFDEPLRQAMVRETELFFGAILSEDRSVVDFLDADYTFVNERLARHYGLEGVQGEKFRRVSLKSGRRGGLLGQASILTVTSNPTRTSPVKRGKWILEQLLGTPPPPPPPNVPELDDDKKTALAGSLRQRMEQHRANPSCASCHSKMDPLGFGLENYDAVGSWRDKDGTFAIDSSGTLPSGQNFKDPQELKTILKGKKAEFVRCLTEKMMIYATGRGLEDFDTCSVDKVVKTLETDDRLSRLILEVVRSDPFQKRRG